MTPPISKEVYSFLRPASLHPLIQWTTTNVFLSLQSYAFSHQSEYN